jgi:hypothetical protein
MPVPFTSRRPILIAVAGLLSAGIAATGMAQPADVRPVSPGDKAQSPEIGGPCPTFSWSASHRGKSLELVVFRPAPERDQPNLVIQKELHGGARTWTPELAECLAWGEEYGWFLRRLGEEPGPWSEPRYFSLPDAPTEAQAARAARTLKRYLDQRQGGAGAGSTLSGAPALVGPDVRDEAQQGEDSERTSGEVQGEPLPDTVKVSGSLKMLKRSASAKTSHTSAALRGIQGDTSGEAYGLWGESPSPDGGGVYGRATATTGDAPGVTGVSAGPQGAGVLGMATDTGGANAGLRGTSSSADGTGVLAENLEGGPDLVLGGSPEARLTEAGITLESSNAETFAISNAGSGSVSLAVDGSAVQSRVTGTCPNYTQFAGVNADGSAACVPLATGIGWTADDGGGDAVGRWTSIAVRDDGTPVISYEDVTNGNLKVFDCDDAACSSGTARIADDGSGNSVGSYTSIVVRDDGKPIISYRDNTNNNLKVFDCDDAACSSGTARTVHATGDSVGRSTSIAVRDDGTPVVSYYDGTNGNLKVFDCDDAACSSGIDRTPDDGGGNDVGLYTSIAVRDDGTPVISYEDVTNGNLRVFDCDDAACSSGIVRLADDGGGNDVGRHTSIAVRDDGTPVISHEDVTNGNLKVFDCDDAACSSGIVRLADDGGGNDVGGDTSIAVRDDGTPVISYRDRTNGNLKVFDCGNASCSIGTARTADDVGNVGRYTSIAVRDDGTAIISQFEDTGDIVTVDGNLKLFSCGDPDCAR